MILEALQERKERIASQNAGERRLGHVLEFLEKEVWPQIPEELLGRPMSKEEREQILGYVRDGV